MPVASLTSASDQARVARRAGRAPRSVHVQCQLIDTPVPGLGELDAQTSELEVGARSLGIAGGLKSVKGMKNLTAS